MRKNSKRTSKRKEPTARDSAVAVMEFMNSGAVPDFLSDVVMVKIDRACEHTSTIKPVYEPGTEGRDLDSLEALFKRTRMLNLTNLEESAAGLARHIAAIYKHPLTPARLYNDIGNFVTDGTNLKISACESQSDSLVDTRSDITLAEEWTWTPRTLERIIKVTNTYDGAPRRLNNETIQTF
jgi:hypothetical protein